MANKLKCETILVQPVSKQERLETFIFKMYCKKALAKNCTSII